MGRTRGERSKEVPQPSLAGRRPSARHSGQLSGRVHCLARPGVVQSLSALEPPPGVFFADGWNPRKRVLQHGQRSERAAYRPPIPFLCGLVPCKWRRAQEGSANDAGNVYRGGFDLPRKRGRQRERRKGCRQAGRTPILPRERDSESRAPMKMTIERPNLSIPQSLNQESLNQRITQSINQPIKLGIYRANDFHISPVAGRMAEQPHTQTTKGRRFHHLRLRHTPETSSRVGPQNHRRQHTIVEIFSRKVYHTGE
jgi:hypothetical protein